MSGRDKDPRPFKCSHPGCNWTFSRQEHQSRHLRTHSGERPFLCTYDNCPSRFARNDELKRHIRLVHEYDTADSSEAPTATRHEAALADGDEVVYNGHSRRQSEQLSSGRSHGPTYPRSPSRYDDPPSHRGSSNHSRTQLPPRAATSMSHYSSYSSQSSQSSQSRQTPTPSPGHYSSYSSQSRQTPTPDPGRHSSYSSQSRHTPTPGPSSHRYPTTRPPFMPPIVPMHPPLPMHYRAPDPRPYTPVNLPPLRYGPPSYDTDEEEPPLPGFSEVANQKPVGGGYNSNLYPTRPPPRHR